MTIYRPSFKRNGKSQKLRVYHVAARIGGIRKRASTGCRDRRAATERGRAIVAKWEREAVGLHDPAEGGPGAIAVGHFHVVGQMGPLEQVGAPALAIQAIAVEKRVVVAVELR